MLSAARSIVNCSSPNTFVEFEGVNPLCERAARDISTHALAIVRSTDASEGDSALNAPSSVLLIALVMSFGIAVVYVHRVEWQPSFAHGFRCAAADVREEAEVSKE